MNNAIKFKQSNLKRQAGEIARFKVVQGPDYGTVFVVVGDRVSIGRGEENDITISDLKASRVHAQLFGAVGGGWIIRDKGSANGILHNGKVTREAPLKSNDTITVGETTLEFLAAEVRTMMLTAPPKTINQVQAEQKNLDEYHQKMSSIGLGAIFKNGAPSPAGSQKANKNSIVVIAVVVIVVGFLFLGDDGKDKKKKAVGGAPPPTKDEEQIKNLKAYLPNFEVNKATDTLFKDGLREYFAGNFNRARTQFETVLQISPDHPLATIYLENCDITVKEEVKRQLEYGKKALDSGKLRDAKAHFERVMRLLYKDQSNPAYIESRDQLAKVIHQMEGR